MFKPKAQEFRKQIRRQYLNEYFKKKRKQFSLIPQPLHSGQESSIQKLNEKITARIVQNKKIVPEEGVLNLQELLMVAKFSEIELGIQCLSRTEIPLGILPYLAPKYYNTQQQHLATCLFGNITFLKPATCPTHQFMRNITNIIENTDMYAELEVHNVGDIRNMLVDTVDNCLMIMYNLMLEFDEATEFYIQECNLIGILFGMCESGPIDERLISKLLKIMTRVTAYHKGRPNKNVVRKFLKHYITIFENSNENQSNYLSLANISQLLTIYVDAIEPQQNFVKSYEISLGSQNNIPKFNQTQKELQQIISRIEKSQVLNKLTNMYPYGTAYPNITRIVFLLLRLMLIKMDKQTVKNKLFDLLNRIIDSIYKKDAPNHQNHFAIKKEQDRQIQIYKTQTQFYQIIYVFLQIWSNHHQILVEHPIYQKICSKFQDFEESNKNPDKLTYGTRRYFIYIFGLLAFSGKLNPHMKYILGQSLKKYRESQENEDFDNKSEENQNFEGFITLLQQELGNSGQDFQI